MTVVDCGFHSIPLSTKPYAGNRVELWARLGGAAEAKAATMQVGRSMLKRLRDELREPNAHPRAPDECADSPLAGHAFTSLHEHQTGARLMVTLLGCDLWDAGEDEEGVAP